MFSVAIVAFTSETSQKDEFNTNPSTAKHLSLEKTVDFSRSQLLVSLRVDV